MFNFNFKTVEEADEEGSETKGSMPFPLGWDPDQGSPLISLSHPLGINLPPSPTGVRSSLRLSNVRCLSGKVRSMSMRFLSFRPLFPSFSHPFSNTDFSAQPIRYDTLLPQRLKSSTGNAPGGEDGQQPKKHKCPPSVVRFTPSPFFFLPLVLVAFQCDDANWRSADERGKRLLGHQLY